jgi:hypothetical protein
MSKATPKKRGIDAVTENMDEIAGSITGSLRLHYIILFQICQGIFCIFAKFLRKLHPYKLSPLIPTQSKVRLAVFSLSSFTTGENR